MSTHNLCFKAKLRKNVYPCIPLFHFINMGCKGVYITRTCLHAGKILRPKDKLDIPDHKGSR